MHAVPPFQFLWEKVEDATAPFLWSHFMLISSNKQTTFGSMLPSTIPTNMFHKYAKHLLTSHPPLDEAHHRTWKTPGGEGDCSLGNTVHSRGWTLLTEDTILK